jgi:hypothetical protein
MPGPARKDTGTVGRGDVQGSDGTSGGGHDSSASCSPPRAGVVIHATVEHIGPGGDTELSVNVKWPASAFCRPAGKKPAASADQVSGSQFVPENGPDATLWAEASADPGPFAGSKGEAKPTGSKWEAEDAGSKWEAEDAS